MSHQPSIGRQLYDAGFDVTPICPPDATVYGWENRGTKENPQWHEVILEHAPGKSPGHFNRGKWHPKKGWRDPTPWSAVYDTWQNSGVGVLCGGEYNIIGLDFDITHTDASRYIYAKMQQTFGSMPARVGQPPKFLIPARAESSISKKWSKGYTFAGLPNQSRLEILASGQQFVAYGIHPKTDLPYQWYVQNFAECSPESLRVFSLSELDGICSFVSEVLVKFGGTEVSNAGSGRVGKIKIDRKNLYADDPEDVIQVLRLIPVGKDRAERMSVAHNIIGALGKTDASKELWFLWCEQFRGWSREDGETVWASIRTDTISSGINALYEKAQPYLEALLKEANANG